MVSLAIENFKTIKKNLTTPLLFKKNNNDGKACFSYNYKLYGMLETWILAWEKLKELPANENIFHELILENTNVKPYLDVEWYQEKYPDLVPEKVLFTLKENIVELFKKEWEYSLNLSDIYSASCHRNKSEGFKYSYRIVVSTHRPMMVFENTNSASYFGKQIRNSLKDIPSEIIDMAVYKKTQNIRFIGHCKAGEYIPMQKVNLADNDLDFIITNVDPENILIEVPEQKDFLYKNIKGIKGVDFEDPEIIKYILDKVKTIHPTSEIERIDANKFIQMNYTDRNEPCFCFNNTHAKLGFFCYIQNDLICIGCHSGKCVDEQNRKIIKILGSINSIKPVSVEKVDCNNIFDNIDHSFIKKCIYDGSFGMSNLFEKMYLFPKRVKWINDSNSGSTYYWDGLLWKQDEYSFVERLITSNIVRILRSFLEIYRTNDDPNVSLDNESSLVKDISTLIKKLNEGSNLSNILKFLKPLLNDSEFLKIKDIHPYMLSCKNGMVDLKTGILRPCIPDDNVTKSLDISFDQEARIDEFDTFIKQITSSIEGEDPELYNYFKWCMGYCLQGHPVKKIFFILFSELGFNGKSLVVNTIKNVVSFYAVAMDKSIVVNSPTKTGGSHSSEICQLENSRYGILSETREDDVINDVQVKIMTGITDKLSVREIYGKQKEFSPTFVPIIASNHKLKINLKDEAMYERLILIPFRLSFKENPDPNKPWERKGDPFLADKFNKNKEGILKWLIEASMYYHANINLPLPASVLKAKMDYRRDMDDYASFIDSSVIFTNSKKDFIAMPELITLYKVFCNDNRLIFDKRKAEKMLDDSLKDFKTKSGNYVSCKIKQPDATFDFKEASPE